MASALWGAEQSQGRLEAELAECADRDGEHLEDFDMAIAVARRLAHVIREIADGIAWRTLRYDRAAIYQLALKNPTGHLELESTAQELAYADVHVRSTGDLVIMNDLTNFLRYGDYTAVAGDGTVRIAEVKGGKGSAKSGRATRQRRKLDEVLQFLHSSVRLTDHGAAALFLHKTRPRTHLEAVCQVIRQARVEGSAHARLSDCLAVDAWDTEVLFEQGRTPDLLSPFVQSRQAYSRHSLTFFDTFPRNVAPYSVFPFPDQDCTDLMTGALWLHTHFNHGNLVRCLRRRGFSVRLPTNSEIEAYEQLRPGERRRARDEPAIRLWRPPDNKVLTLSGALLSRLLYEYLDEECFVDCAEEVFALPESALTLFPAAEEMLPLAESGLTLFPAFDSEADLWD
jgi:hypothetical protein